MTIEELARKFEEGAIADEVGECVEYESEEEIERERRVRRLRELCQRKRQEQRKSI